MAEHVESSPLLRRVQFDTATVLGLGGALVLIALAIAFGGSARAFIDLPSILIVVGGTLAVTTICFSLAEVKQTVSVLGSTIVRRDRDAREVAYTMLELADYSRKHGVLGLQGAALGRFAA